MHIDREALLARWPLAVGHPEAAELISAWGSGQRGYHDLQHLQEVLDHLDALAASGAPFDREAVHLAAWFHDAVYDGSADQEARSAQLASEVLVRLGREDLAGEVRRLVLLTRDHVARREDQNAAALMDADLAILAADSRRYAEYVAGVRREYAHYSDRDFALGRLAVLQPLAAGDLFLTAHGRQLWEPAARANLAAEITALASQAERQ